MHWIIEENVFPEVQYNKFIEIFEKKNISCSIVKVIPFEHRLVNKLEKINNPIVVYGSFGLSKQVDKFGWKPGYWPIKQGESEFSKILGNKYLNHDGFKCKISEVLDIVKWDEFFIKPDADSKEFAGQILKYNEFANWYDKLIEIGYLDDNDFDVFIALPKQIDIEYRVIVVNDKIVDYCMYRQFDISRQREVQSSELENFVKQLYKPTDVFVVDICKNLSGDLKVLEYNAFNSAALYVCNIEKIIEAIENM